MRPRSDTLLIWTGGSCSYGCGACPIDRAVAVAGVQLAELQQALAAVPAREGRLALLLGGEPFLRPDHLRLLAAIQAAGCVPGVVTTGRALIYPQRREKLRRLGVGYLRVQLFGVGERHDAATAVAGGFAQALDGVRAWIAEANAECDVDVALSTRQQSLANIVAEIEQLAQSLGSNIAQIVVALDPSRPVDEEAARRALAALAHWNDDPDRPLLVWEGLPRHLVAGAAAIVAPLRPAFVGVAAAASCLGPTHDIVRVRTVEREVVQANSFNYVRSQTSVPFSAEAAGCNAYRAGDGSAPQRRLWLVEGEQLILYSTDTGDFDAAVLSRIKDEWSHLFFDRAPAGVLDDFTDGMRRVVPDPTCDGCEHRHGCGRRFHIVDGPPYAREEAWIAAHVAGLRGHVLDVGCGEQLYRGELAPLLRCGAVQYTGLDPDEISLKGARAALPEGSFHLGGIEDFRGGAASYDHILCLRSLNHVFDVDEALARMSELLKPGGTLLIVECTPFAMLRRPEQVAAADAAPRAGHQHLRNLAGDEVVPWARRRGLRVVHHHAAARATTNEWILLLERAGTLVPVAGRAAG